MARQVRTRRFWPLGFALLAAACSPRTEDKAREMIAPYITYYTNGAVKHAIFDVTLGDLDGDSRKDLVVSSPGSGKAFVFFAPVSQGRLSTLESDITISGKRGLGGSANGRSVLIADLEGRNGGDLLLGNGLSGEVYVFENL